MGVCSLIQLPLISLQPNQIKHSAKVIHWLGIFALISRKPNYIKGYKPGALYAYFFYMIWKKPILHKEIWERCSEVTFHVIQHHCYRTLNLIRLFFITYCTSSN